MHTRKVVPGRFGFVVTLASVVMCMAPPSAEGVASTQGTPHSPGVLAECVHLALRKASARWVCTGDGLSETVLREGRPVQVFTPLKRAIGAPEGTFGRRDGEWCADATCHRVISDYIAETVGNGIYGTSHAVEGRVRFTLRVNLNGTQPRFTVSFDVMDGPAVDPMMSVNCNDLNGPFPHSSCGSWSTSPKAFKRVWKSKIINGNRLADDDNYNASLGVQFKAQGVPRPGGGPWTATTVHSKRWLCTTPRGAARKCTF
ncbi:hypothetical protein GCM10010329_61520 [Streptomyces spiroverticillatus]|uniref:Uncharacterized protein n=1 Tax=Streptomyces finlayi TaxID=67296 RepID=A0A919CEH9_9ACTN|nr:hypothetical protein GCM10010329_61520 [Streptomyces spiroverticillatus]GHD15135.1 hypothetical protein GCM10010334_74930 [Streptomyces finlayi]